MHAKHTMLGRVLLSRSSGQQYVNRGLSQLVLRLVNGREGRMSDRGHFDVIEPNERHVSRNSHSKLYGRFEDPERHSVVRGEDRRDITTMRQEFKCDSVAAIESVSPMQDGNGGLVARLA